MTCPRYRYARRPAVLINVEVAEPRIQNAYQSRSGFGPSAGIATLTEATIFGGGTIGVDDGRFMAESRYTVVAQFPDVGEICHTNVIPPSFDRAIFAGRHAQMKNYGHFLVDVLSRLLLGVNVLPDDVPILLYESGKPFAEPILRVAGLDPERVSWIGRRPINVRTLYWPTPNTLHPLHHSPRVFPCLRSMVDTQDCGQQHQRLFVSRAQSDRRRLLNEDEIFEALVPWGFERILPGQLPFEEQIRLFMEARLVVAICGAGLANMVFMPPGGTVVMMSPSSMAGVFFWDIAHHRDISLVALWGKNDHASKGGQDVDFCVDTHLVKGVVARALDAESQT